MRDNYQINIEKLGIIEYGECLLLQQRTHAQIVGSPGTGTLLCVEHPDVLTLGKHADLRHLKMAEPYLQSIGIQIHRIDRGGEVTAHEPGQLVVYPIVRLFDLGLMPRQYVSILEDAVISTLLRFDIQASRDEEHPGVWVGSNKICAIGVRIKERVSLHGIALNVCNTMKLFNYIVPCGISGRGVTSISRELGRQVDVSQVESLLIDEIRTRMRPSLNSTSRH